MKTTATPDPAHPPRVRITAGLDRYLAAMRRAWHRPILTDPAADDDRA